MGIPISPAHGLVGVRRGAGFSVWTLLLQTHRILRTDVASSVTAACPDGRGGTVSLPTGGEVFPSCDDGGMDSHDHQSAFLSYVHGRPTGRTDQRSCVGAHRSIDWHRSADRAPLDRALPGLQSLHVVRLWHAHPTHDRGDCPSSHAGLHG